MSTRSQIKISYLHREVLLYHHWDGYPISFFTDNGKTHATLKYIFYFVPTFSIFKRN